MESTFVELRQKGVVAEVKHTAVIYHSEGRRSALGLRHALRVDSPLKLLFFSLLGKCFALEAARNKEI